MLEDSTLPKARWTRSPDRLWELLCSLWKNPQHRNKRHFSGFFCGFTRNKRRNKGATELQQRQFAANCRRF